MTSFLDLPDEQDPVTTAKTASKSLASAKYKFEQSSGGFLMQASSKDEFISRATLADEMLTEIVASTMPTVSDAKAKLVRALYRDWEVKRASTRLATGQSVVATEPIESFNAGGGAVNVHPGDTGQIVQDDGNGYVVAFDNLDEVGVDYHQVKPARKRADTQITTPDGTTVQMSPESGQTIITAPNAVPAVEDVNLPVEDEVVASKVASGTDCDNCLNAPFSWKVTDTTGQVEKWCDGCKSEGIDKGTDVDQYIQKVERYDDLYRGSSKIARPGDYEDPPEVHGNWEYDPYAGISRHREDRNLEIKGSPYGGEPVDMIDYSVPKGPRHKLDVGPLKDLSADEVRSHLNSRGASKGSGSPKA